MYKFCEQIFVLLLIHYNILKHYRLVTNIESFGSVVMNSTLQRVEFAYLVRLKLFIGCKHSTPSQAVNTSNL